MQDKFFEFHRNHWSVEKQLWWANFSSENEFGRVSGNLPHTFALFLVFHMHLLMPTVGSSTWN